MVAGLFSQRGVGVELRTINSGGGGGTLLLPHLSLQKKIIVSTINSSGVVVLATLVGGLAVVAEILL